MATIAETTDAGIRRHALGERLRIGRESDNELQLADPKVSRHHVEIVRLPDGRHRIVDLSSSRGTFVSGRRITDLVLMDGDDIVVGDVCLRFEDSERRSLTVEEITIEPEATEVPVQQRLSLDEEMRFPAERDIELSERLRLDYERLRGAFELTRAIAGESDLGRMVQKLLETVLRLVQADRAAAILIDPATSRPLMRMARTRSGSSERWSLSRSVIDEVIGNRTAVLSGDTGHDERFARSQSIQACGGRSVMCVPMIHRQEVLGVLYLDSLAPETAFRDSDLELLATLAGQAALVMRNSLLRKRIDDYAAEERKRLERTLRDLPDGLVLLDESRQVVLLNARAEALLAGVAPLEKGKPMVGFGPLGIEEVLALEGKGSTEIEIEGPPRRIFQLTVSKSPRPDREAHDTVVVLREVTEEKERDARAAFNERLSLVGQLAGGVSHDFNNLLTVIRSAADVCSATAPASLKEEIQEIQRATLSAAALTRQLLAFSRREEAHPSLLSLGDTVRGIERMVRHAVGDRVELGICGDPALRPVRMDAAQLERVVLNLAVNARDAMPEGGCLNIEAENIGQDEAVQMGLSAVPYVRLRVRDTGCGMTPEVQARIFEPFFTTKPRGHGTGLGLATVYGIVQQAGGAIRVVSHVGAGTRFDVLLPAANGRAVLQEVSGGNINWSVGAGVTVLVVEDEPGVRRLASRLLRGAGFEALEASGAEEAVLLAGSHEGAIDLLLTDVLMPQMCGPDLARQIEALRPHIGTLYMSGHTDGALRDLDAAQLLQKPFSRDELIHRVLELLEVTKRRARGRSQPAIAIAEEMSA